MLRLITFNYVMFHRNVLLKRLTVPAFVLVFSSNLILCFSSQIVCCDPL